MRKGAVAREAAGPVVRREGSVLQLLVERSHLVCVPLIAFRPGETRSSEEAESAVRQDEKCLLARAPMAYWIMGAWRGPKMGPSARSSRGMMPGCVTLSAKDVSPEVTDRRTAEMTWKM